MARAVWANRSTWASVASLCLAGLAAGAPPAFGEDGVPEPAPIGAAGKWADPGVRRSRFQLPPIPDGPSEILRAPGPEPTFPAPSPEPTFPIGTSFGNPVYSPNGYTGPSSILPTEGQTSADFIPIEDRWRIGFPAWDRYEKGHPPQDDYPFVLGRLLDPYNQNVFKGDYPIIGNHTFLDVTATTLNFFEYRRVVTQTGPFESTSRAGQFPFFGRPNQFFFQNLTNIGIELSHGDAAFKPADWKIKVTPTFNVNNLSLSELAQVNPNVLAGTQRSRTFFALQELFGEMKLADTSPNYDFTSLRAGTQFFNSDFRGFVFSDANRAVRLFGTRNANRDQFNVIYFRQWEKDTNSGLNSWHDRHQNVFIANYYRQDFIVPGYTVQGSIHYNNDEPFFKLNKNRQLNRPDPVGIFQQHRIDAVYLGFTGDGHFGRFNVNHAFYWVFGRDGLNPLANRGVEISAQMAAIELSYDRDWMRFRTSFLWQSGDGNINNGKATGWDSILDNQVFAGGIFSYIQRQAIPIFGVNLFNPGSLMSDLRSNKIQSQSNFVNPGQLLFNLGQDMDLTPRLRMVNNMNFLMFDKTNVLQQFLYSGTVHRTVGIDMSSGFEWRPFLNDQMIVIAGANMLLPGLGFRDIYSNFGYRTDTPVSAFCAVTLAY